MKHILDWKTDYDNLEETVKAMGAKRVCFSIFETEEGDWGDGSPGSWKVSAPDILSDNPALVGKVQLQTSYWRVTDGELVKSLVISNPTWKDIILAVDEILKDGDGCGIFLEGLRYQGLVDGVKVFDLVIGS